MNKLVLILALIPAVLMGCNRGSKIRPSSAVEPAKDPSLQGTWQSECLAEPKNAFITGVASGFQASVKSSRLQFKFAGDAVTLTTIYYNQANCHQDAWIFEESGNFKTNQDKRSNDNGKEIDFDFREVTARVIDQNGATAANGISMCGKSNWAANSKKEQVTKSAKEPSCYGTDVPRKVPTLYRIDGDSLVLGAPAKTTAERPSTLDFTIRYKGK